jgi:hypothetical protein
MRQHVSWGLTHLAEKYISSEHDVDRCSYILLSSALFEKNEDYVRRQIVYCLLQVRLQHNIPTQVLES